MRPHTLVICAAKNTRDVLSQLSSDEAHRLPQPFENPTVLDDETFAQARSPRILMRRPRAPRLGDPA